MKENKMKENKEREVVNILWTGGYDSSFRMVQLSKKDVIVQPYYLSDNRKSEANEFHAMAEITSDIRNHPETKCEILPLISRQVKDIKEDKEITEAYNRLRKISPIGSQFEWLARFAKENELTGLELGIERAETGSAYIRNLFKEFDIELKPIDSNGIHYYVIDNKSKNSDISKIFGHYHFPLWDMSKVEMLPEFKNLGFEDSVTKTWFCHKPINNKPCGICNPCSTTISSGMGFRLTKLGLFRNRFKKIYKAKNLLGRAVQKAKFT